MKNDVYDWMRRYPSVVVTVLTLTLMAVGFMVATSFISPAHSKPDQARLAAEKFLTQLGNGQVFGAYNSADPSFKEQWDMAGFKVEARDLGLTQYSMSEWSEISFAENGEAMFTGKIKTFGGVEVPLEITLTEDKDSWKVSGISGERGLVDVNRSSEFDDDDDSSNGGVPGAGKLKKLAGQAVQELNISILTRDFEPFHKYISKTWRDRITAEDLQAAFQGYIDAGVDMSGADGVSPVFDEEPVLGEDGRLSLVGHFPTSPRKVHFKMSFIKEHKDWRLSGIGVELETDYSMPDPGEISRMSEETMLVLGYCIAADDFKSFHAHISKQWRNVTTPEQLRETFKGLGKRSKPNRWNIKGVTPIFTEKPHIDRDGYLVMAGYYPGQYKVHFDLTYVLEGRNWKLIEIGVNVK